MYIFLAEHVHMIEVTLTELRKDLFKIIDRVAETGEVLRVRRQGRVIDLSPQTTDKPAVELTPQQRWARFLERPERDIGKPSDFESLENAGHWEWSGEVEPN